MADKITKESVDEVLARWREIAGPDWRDVLAKRRDLCRNEYEGTGRIDAAWEAVLLSRVLDEPPPAWVLDYLATVAMGIHHLALGSMQGDTVEPKALGRALGSVRKGAGTGFPSEKDWQWALYAFQVRDLIGQEKEYRAIEIVAKENGVSESTVRTAWKRLQSATPDGG